MTADLAKSHHTLAQQGADLGGGIIDFDLEHRISRLQFPLLRLELLSPGSLG
jgi:hypothetical protein